MNEIEKRIQEQQKLLYCSICKSKTCGYVLFEPNQNGVLEVVNKHFTLKTEVEEKLKDLKAI